MQTRIHPLLFLSLFLLGFKIMPPFEQNGLFSRSKPQSENDNKVKIEFEECEIEIDDLYIWDQGGKLKKKQGDKAVVYLELGANIQGKKMKIHKFKKGELRVFQRFENSLTVMNEGPHCDLIDWKHYYSDWKELTINNGQFVTESYPAAASTKFIDIDMPVLRAAVRQHCGESWANLIKETPSPTTYPCGVGMSRIFIKIMFIEAQTNILKEHLISFEIPMGC